MDINKDFLDDLPDQDQIVDIPQDLTPTVQPTANNGITQVEVQETLPPEGLVVTEAYKQLVKTHQQVQVSRALYTEFQQLKGISQEHATYLDSRKPGFITPRRTVKQFTKGISTSFYKDALEHLNHVTALEEADFDKTFKMFFKAPMEDLKQFHDLFETTYRPQINYLLQNILTNNKDLIKSYRTSPNFVVAIGDKFPNVITETIREVAGYYPDDNVHQLLLAGIDCPGMMALLEGCLESHTVGEMIEHYRSGSLAFSTENITYTNLLDIATAGTMPRCVDALEEVLDKALREFDQMTEHVNKIEAEDGPYDAFFVVHQKMFQSLLTQIEFVEAVTRRLIIALPALDKSFSELGKLV